MAPRVCSAPEMPMEFIASVNRLACFDSVLVCLPCVFPIKRARGCLGVAHLTTNPTLSRLCFGYSNYNTSREEWLPSMLLAPVLRMGQPIPSMSPHFISVALSRFSNDVILEFNLVHESFPWPVRKHSPEGLNFGGCHSLPHNTTWWIVKAVLNSFDILFYLAMPSACRILVPLPGDWSIVLAMKELNLTTAPPWNSLIWNFKTYSRNLK